MLLTKQVESNTSETKRRPLRLGIVNEFFYPDNAGGTGTVLSELAASLRQLHPEIEITVVTSRNGYRTGTCDYSPTEDWNGIKITRVGTPSTKGKGVLARLLINTAFATAALQHLLRENAHKKFDAILVGTAPPTLAGCAHTFRILQGVPFIYVVYDLDPDRAIVLGMLPPKSIPASILRSLQKTWLQAASKVVVLGRCMQDYLKANYGIANNKVAVIPIGANPQEIQALPCDNEYRTQLGFTRDEFIICYSGNFGRYHNFDALLDAARIIGEEGGKVRFLLVGDGAQQKRIAGRIENEKLHNVRLMHFVPKEDYARLLSIADVSVVTLEPNMEGLCVPSKFYSILASGRAVLGLVSPLSEVARVIEEEKCGIQVTSGDVEGIVQAIHQLTAPSTNIEAMGIRSRNALVDRFSNTIIAEQYRTALLDTCFSEWDKSSTRPQDSRVVNVE